MSEQSCYVSVHFYVPVKDHENSIPIHKEVCTTRLFEKTRFGGSIQSLEQVEVGGGRVHRLFCHGAQTLAFTLRG